MEPYGFKVDEVALRLWPLTRIITGVVALSLAPVIGTSGPIGLAQLDRMVRDAKLIVVARVVHGGQAGTLASLTLEVQRTLKGHVSLVLVNASIAIPEEFATNKNLIGLQGMWFLSDDGRGGNRVLPAMIGAVPLQLAILPSLPDLPQSWVGPENASPTEGVLREIAAALEINPGFLQTEFISQSVSSESASSLRRVYRRMEASPSPVVAAAGVAGLLRSGDVQGLQSLASLLERGPLPSGGPQMGQAVCEYFNGNPRGLEILAGLAAKASSMPRLRTCAAFVLRNLHSKESLPYLVDLLDSDDQYVRYEGIAGLTSYANSGLIPNERPLVVDDIVHPRLQKLLRTDATAANFPTLETFRRDESGSISFWRQWMRDRAVDAVP